MSHKVPSRLLMYPLMLDKFRVNYSDYMVGFLLFCMCHVFCECVFCIGKGGTEISFNSFLSSFLAGMLCKIIPY